MKSSFTSYLLAFIIIVSILLPTTAFSQVLEPDLPEHLRDRGTGIPTSQFGTYIRKGEFLVYPFYEYYYDSNLEYEPADFGYPLPVEFRGKSRAHEFLIFLAYGVSDRLALEFEAGVIDAKLYKADDDPTDMPDVLQESGLSDVEGQVRWRWNFEQGATPEFYNYFEYVLPTGEKNSLIGTAEWELKLGLGVIKGYRWGTMTFRAALNWTEEEKKIAPDEYAIEYLRRLSDRARFFFMMEGSDDEIALIPEIQWHFHRSIYLKANCGFGVTSKATDFAPEIGVMFSFMPRG